MLMSCSDSPTTGPGNTGGASEETWKTPSSDIYSLARRTGVWMDEEITKLLPTGLVFADRRIPPENRTEIVLPGSWDAITLTRMLGLKNGIEIFPRTQKTLPFEHLEAILSRQ